MSFFVKIYIIFSKSDRKRGSFRSFEASLENKDKITKLYKSK